MMKKVFPTIWFGFIAIFFVVFVASGVGKKDFMLLVIPLVMAVFGYFLMKNMLWDLMDEVVDCGSYLVVKFRGSEETIQLSNVMNVSATTSQNPPRITLRLRSPCKFGNEVSFFPASRFSLNPFKKNEIAEDLIFRSDKARNGNIG